MPNTLWTQLLINLSLDQLQAILGREEACFGNLLVELPRPAPGLNARIRGYLRGLVSIERDHGYSIGRSV